MMTGFFSQTALVYVLEQAIRGDFEGDVIPKFPAGKNEAKKYIPHDIT